MKFIAFLEGDLEYKAIPNFLKRWLDNQQLSGPVGIKPVNFKGWGNLIEEAPRKVQNYLQSPEKDEIIAIIGLIDLHGPNSSNFYPSSNKSMEERFAWGKQEIERRIGNSRFHHFFAVHEIEAWLLSEPRIFPNPVGRALRSTPSPENINFQTPPKKRINSLYQQYLNRNYKETVDGPSLFSRLDPEIAYEKCPKLKLLLDTMLELARQAGC